MLGLTSQTWTTTFVRRSSAILRQLHFVTASRATSTSSAVSTQSPIHRRLQPTHFSYLQQLPAFPFCPFAFLQETDHYAQGGGDVYRSNGGPSPNTFKYDPCPGAWLSRVQEIHQSFGGNKIPGPASPRTNRNTFGGRAASCAAYGISTGSPSKAIQLYWRDRYSLETC
jgi:hypothetical protein